MRICDDDIKRVNDRLNKAVHVLGRWRRRARKLEKENEQLKAHIKLLEKHLF